MGSKGNEEGIEGAKGVDLYWGIAGNKYFLSQSPEVKISKPG